MSCRHKTVVPSRGLYEYKLSVNMKSLIWYKQPVSQFSTARISLFGKTVNLGFGNQSISGVREAEFQIADSFQLANFYEKPIIVEIVNSNDGRDGGQVVAYCQLDPRVISEKPIIAPILSSCCSCSKLGDIEILFKLTKSATDICQLREIDRELDMMISKCPNHFDNLYCKLRR